MKKDTELLFVRKMLENMLDQGEMDTVYEMSRRIDEATARRIAQDRRETAKMM